MGPNCQARYPLSPSLKCFPILQKSLVYTNKVPPRTQPNIPTSSRPKMPARVRSTLQRSLVRPLDGAGVLPCQSLSICRRTFTTRTANNASKIAHARRAVHPSAPRKSSSPRSFTTATTISTVPSRFKELHDALSGVKDAGIEQVSVSRLQLALRGLESEEPLIRIAGEFCDQVGAIGFTMALPRQASNTSTID